MNNVIIETKNYRKQKMPKKKKLAVIIAASLASACLCAAAFWLFHPHIYKEWQIITAPTCTETGEGIFKCFCGETETRILDTDPINGHTKITDKGFAATKTENGLTDGSHCGICNVITDEQRVIYALGSQGLTYLATSEATCEITGIGTCSDAELIIPAYIDGYKVTGIGDYAFVGCEGITSVVVPEGVTVIGHRAFESCTSITSMELPESITKIGNGAFCGLISIESITIPSAITVISTDAFMNLWSLTEITIPENVTSIESYAFSCCSKLESISLPKSLTSIGKDAFQSCSELKSITFSGSLAEWDSVAKDTDWDYNIPEYTVYCTDGAKTVTW
jgi:hypothetical protein